MKIGVAGPVDLSLLRDLFPPDTQFPQTVSFPLVAHLARALRRRGHDLSLFTLSRQVTQTQRITGDRIEVFICPQRMPRYQMFDLFWRERRILKRAIQTSGCQVIHAHWTYEFAMAALSSRLPHVITAHDVFTQVRRYEDHPYMLEKLLLAYPVLRRAKSVTAVSPYVRSQLLPYCRRDCKVAVVPNGVSGDVTERFFRRAPNPHTPFTYAAIMNGGLVRKNIHALIDAFARVRTQAKDSARLVLFGGGLEHGSEVQRWAVDHGLDAGIHFQGVLPYPDLMDRLAEQIDVLVHPSLEESFCMAAAEAMAMGIPVIGGFHSGGVPWVLGYGSAGILVDVDSPQSIAEAMLVLWQDPERRNALAGLARKRVLDEFSLETVAQKYEIVLMEALRDQKR